MDGLTVMGYLLDTNHVSAVCRKDSVVQRKIDALPEDTLVLACAITLGEIEAGHKMNATTNRQRRDGFIARLNEKFLPRVIPVSHDTRFKYAEIIGRLWAKKPPPSAKVKTERYLVEQFSVDINDAWTVACAWEHGLTFVTHDKMERIREVVSESEVPFECWLPR